MSQNNGTKVEVTFIIESPALDLDEFTRRIDIRPTGIRTKDDWPYVIKKGIGIPKELQARCVWELAESEYTHIEIENVFNKIKTKLDGKQQIILETQKIYDAKSSVVIDIYCKEEKIPALILSTEAIAFLNSINTELCFNICIFTI